MENQQQTEGFTLPLVKYTSSELEIRGVIAQYQDLHIITDSNENYMVVMKALGVLRKFRTGIERDRKEIGGKILDFKKQWDDEAKRLTALLSPTEDRLQTERMIEDKRKEDIQLADERNEQERITGIKTKIQAINDSIPILPMTSFQLQKLLFHIKSNFPYPFFTNEEYAEFKNEMDNAYMQTIQAISIQLESRLQWEKEEADRKAEIELLMAMKKEREEEEKRIAIEKVSLEAEAKAKAEAERARLEVEKAKAEAKRATEEGERIKFEADRIAREEESKRLLAKAIQELGERENALRLEREAMEREKQIEAERIASIARAAQEKAEREEFEKQAKIQAEIEAREKAEREKYERLEQLQAEAVAEAKALALRPDKEKILAWIDALQSVPLPDLKSDYLQKIWAECQFAFNKFLAEIKMRIND